tara:strand:- start:23 stop:319 length:297 start_codon:yes stop_codon:yes gene_type:complete
LEAVELDQDIPLQVQELLMEAHQLLEQHLLYQLPEEVVEVELAVETGQEHPEVQVVVRENVDLEHVLQVEVEHAVKEIQEDLTMLQELVVAVVKLQLD